MDASRSSDASRRSADLRDRPDAEFDSAALKRARRKFLKVFPGGFRDETYLAWERDYKWKAHQEWEAQLDRHHFSRLRRKGKFPEIAAAAVRIESGRSLLFSFEKMAFRDAVRHAEGARIFADGLYAFLYGSEALAQRFEHWCRAVASLPRKQTRVLTWPLVTVFGFISQPQNHIFLKPLAMKRAAQRLGYNLHYSSQPNWNTYNNFLQLAECTREMLTDMRPRDLIDVQSFLWVQGSDEYS